MAAARAALAAGVTLMLSTARGFVLAPSGIPRLSGGVTTAGRHSLSSGTTVRTPTAATHRAAVHPSTTTAPSPCVSATASSFTGCASSSSPYSARASLGNTALGGSRPRQSLVYSATTMGLASSLLPGGGRKMAMVGLLNAAAFATVGGGVLAGGLHAVSGPDHLAALLPRIMGQKWHNSMRIGATWGLGHGFSATVIGLAAFLFKDRMGLGHNERLVAMMGTWTEGLVGVSLIAIGLLGLKESLLDYDGPMEVTEGGTPQSVGAAGVGATAAAARGGGRAIFLNGVLHGFSWDGAPSLAPALALSSWRSVLWFLVAYCSGTMVAMAATTTLIGEGSFRVGKALDKPDIPRKLSVVSSGVAIAIGIIWLAKAVFF